MVPGRRAAHQHHPAHQRPGVPDVGAEQRPDPQDHPRVLGSVRRHATRAQRPVRGRRVPAVRAVRAADADGVHRHGVQRRHAVSVTSRGYVLLHRVLRGQIHDSARQSDAAELRRDHGEDLLVRHARVRRDQDLTLDLDVLVRARAELPERRSPGPGDEPHQLGVAVQLQGSARQEQRGDLRLRPRLSRRLQDNQRLPQGPQDVLRENVPQGPGRGGGGGGEHDARAVHRAERRDHEGSHHFPHTGEPAVQRDRPVLGDQVVRRAQRERSRVGGRLRRGGPRGVRG
mmetsp:Transcript_8803/g.34555  ORF Transcript_8803/g.34555 Transcript_8803/m.34555 type:complete len:286 (-) Transcript_8803:522-1379(-)